MSNATPNLDAPMPPHEALADPTSREACYQASKLIWCVRRGESESDWFASKDLAPRQEAAIRAVAADLRREHHGEEDAAPLRCGGARHIREIVGELLSRLERIRRAKGELEAVGADGEGGV